MSFNRRESLINKKGKKSRVSSMFSLFGSMVGVGIAYNLTSEFLNELTRPREDLIVAMNKLRDRSFTIVKNVMYDNKNEIEKILAREALDQPDVFSLTSGVTLGSPKPVEMSMEDSICVFDSDFYLDKSKLIPLHFNKFLMKVWDRRYKVQFRYPVIVRDPTSTETIRGSHRGTVEVVADLHGSLATIQSVAWEQPGTSASQKLSFKVRSSGPDSASTVGTVSMKLFEFSTPIAMDD